MISWFKTNKYILNILCFPETGWIEGGHSTQAAYGLLKKSMRKKDVKSKGILNIRKNNEISKERKGWPGMFQMDHSLYKCQLVC